MYMYTEYSINTYNEYVEVDSECHGGVVGEGELLEESGLDEGVGLDTLGLLHGHLHTIAADETCGTLCPVN